MFLEPQLYLPQALEMVLAAREELHCTDADGDGICDYHQDGSCQYTDSDGDGVCDQYQEKVSSGLVSGGHHGAGHHGGWGNCHN